MNRFLDEFLWYAGALAEARDGRHTLLSRRYARRMKTMRNRDFSWLARTATIRRYLKEIGRCAGD